MYKVKLVIGYNAAELHYKTSTQIKDLLCRLNQGVVASEAGDKLEVKIEFEKAEDGIEEWV